MRLSSVLLLTVSLLFAAALPLQAVAEPEAAAAPEAAATPEQKKKARERKTPAAPSAMERGSIASVDETGLVVEFRSGKLTRYDRTDKTIVRGQKTAWAALAPGDNVKVRIHGRALHAVVVTPSADQSAEIEAQRQKAQADYYRQQKAAAAKAKANPVKPRAKKKAN